VRSARASGRNRFGLLLVVALAFADASCMGWDVSAVSGEEASLAFTGKARQNGGLALGRAGRERGMDRLKPLAGVVVLAAIAWALSSNRRRFPWRLAAMGLGLQLVIAGACLSFPPLVKPVDWASGIVAGAIRQADEGIVFLFGPELVRADGPWGFIFAVKVLPVIVFFAALMAVLYRVGVMPRIVSAMAWLLHRTLGVSGAEALVAASNVFVGQTEAPLCVRPYIPSFTRAQIMVMMTTGFATIAGSVMAAYVGMLGGESPSRRRCSPST
jgi:CNT family concentrative nucleoside transporter